MCTPCVEAASGPKAHKSGRRESTRAASAAAAATRARLRRWPAEPGDRAESLGACERGRVRGTRCRRERGERLRGKRRNRVEDGEALGEIHGHAPSSCYYYVHASAAPNHTVPIANDVLEEVRGFVFHGAPPLCYVAAPGRATVRWPQGGCVCAG